MSKQYSIYLAGAMVFSPDALKIAEKNKELCELHGFIGLCPLDNEVDFNKPKQEISKEIFRKNLELMEKADIYIGNLENFRGFEPDSGTVWELAYMYGEGKPCYAYLHSFPKTYVQKMTGLVHWEDDQPFDSNGYRVENFDSPLNLMLNHSLDGIYKTLEECLIRLKEYY